MKKITILITAVLLGITLVACDPVPKNGPDVLMVSQAADPVSFDIQTTNDSPTTRIALQIYESLLKSDNNLEIKPSLAESWNKIDDKTYEFKLKENVTFHNGEKFTADDVKWSLERAKTKDAVSHIVGAIDKVEKVDTYKVKITTKEPFGPLLKHLAHPASAIMNEKAVTKAGKKYGTKIAVGTGPYKFKKWSSGKHVILDRNEKYHDEASKGKMKQIVFRIIKEPATALIELENGNIDILYDVSPKNRSQVQNNDKLNLLATDNLGVEYLGFNFKNEHLKDKNIRKAITHLVDVPSIITNIYENVGTRLTGPLNSLIDAYNNELKAYDYDEAKAIEYMKAVTKEDGTQKYPDGKGNFQLKLLVPTNSPERISVANVVKDQLVKIGITVNIEKIEWGSYIAETGAGNHDLFLLGWTTVTADADYGLYALFHSSQFGKAGNRTFYKNEALDKLLDDAKKETDHDERMKKYKEAQEIIHEELPWVFLQTRQNTTGISKKVLGFEHHPMGSYVLKGVYKEVEEKK